MTNKHIIFLVSLLSFLPAWADGSKNDALTPPNQARLSGEVFSFGLHAEGSMYFPEDWNQGRVTLTSGEVVEVERLRYNGYLDQLIWLNPANFQPIQIDKQMVHSFSLQVPYLPDSLYFENITFKRWYESNPINIYGQLMYRGNIRLLAHRRIFSEREVIEERGNALVARAQLKLESIYYILMPDNQAHEFKRLNRKTLYRLFPEHSDALRDAFRQNNLRIRNENELIEAVKIIDQILGKG
ncbi:MAG: hypothetical protein RBS53_10330 [Bacteroidales bacterium]|jgi:hypothetical protein|nr:hypothetical protein [Bacteroidales bacterium]NLM91850.1 hypothetical protein [Bacteroidales bacterium]